jgi:hypothetical protein
LATETATPTSTPEPTHTPAPTNTPVPPSVPTAVASPLPALEQIADTDPGPPFTVEISANRAVQDPLVEESQTYKVTGIVRNDGQETYAVSRINVTFFDAEGFRGYTERTSDLGGWHGAIEADYACLLLAPGEACPFVAAITAQDMAAFLVHPDAVPTGRESAPVELSELSLTYDGTSHVRFTGTATNVNPFKIKNVIVSGVLLDASEQIVSMGSTYVLEQDIASNESVQFDVRIPHEPFESHSFYAQAERDWD